jgi:hypothetical protein
MFKEIRVYFEGDARLRPGLDVFFRELHRRAKQCDCEIYPVASKSGEEACKAFDKALRSHPEAWNILLRDSERPLTAHAVRDLCQRYGWNERCTGSIFWMVEMMESWFHADKDALGGYYGPKFRDSVLSANPDVEQIPKRDLLEGLSRATKETSKGDYVRNKSAHAPKILERLDPQKVRSRAKNCDRLFNAVLAALEDAT